jgi:hypothetical protein
VRSAANLASHEYSNGRSELAERGVKLVVNQFAILKTRALVEPARLKIVASIQTDVQRYS